MEQKMTKQIRLPGLSQASVGCLFIFLEFSGQQVIFHVNQTIKNLNLSSVEYAGYIFLLLLAAPY
jgi:hypothetical protein